MNNHNITLASTYLKRDITEIITQLERLNQRWTDILSDSGTPQHCRRLLEYSATLQRASACIFMSQQNQCSAVEADKQATIHFFKTMAISDDQLTADTLDNYQQQLTTTLDYFKDFFYSQFGRSDHTIIDAANCYDLAYYCLMLNRIKTSIAKHYTL